MAQNPEPSLEELLGRTEAVLLEQLRNKSRAARNAFCASRGDSDASALTPSQRIADAVAATIGSWRFIIVQSCVLALWVVLNVTAYIQHWDPYPFILLNLALSFQAAYAAPFILMSQNRQQEIDRQQATSDYQVNIKAELEIELLHQKIDQLRETEVMALTQAVKELAETIKAMQAGRGA